MVERQLSKFWNLEKNEGFLIVHMENGEVITELKSSATSLTEFNEWVKEATPYISKEPLY